MIDNCCPTSYRRESVVLTQRARNKAVGRRLVEKQATDAKNQEAYTPRSLAS